MNLRKIATPALILIALGAAGCRRTGEVDVTRGVGITAVRSACPAVGVPVGTGDVTVFDPANSRAASAIDVTAVVTNVRSTCDESGSTILTSITFDVQARRTRADAARQVVLPYFVTVVRGGSQVVSKRIERAAIDFAAGAPRASTSVQVTTSVDRAAATLPDEVRRELTRPRKAGAEDAAVDPLADPAIRQAVLNASFEALVGFQLTDDQLRYNATR